MSTQPKDYSKMYLNLKDLYNASPLAETLSFKEYELISNTFFHLLSKSIVDEGKVYYLPPKLGTIGIYKTAKTKKMVDFDLYKKTGIKANIRNLHSHGAMAKVHWQITWPRFRVANYGDPTVFRFKFCRALSRYLAQQIKDNNTISKYYDY